MTTEALLAAMETFPLHAQYGFRVVEADQGACHARVEVGPPHLNVGGVVHGGVMYLLLDVTAYCAALTVLPPDTNATTADLHVSMLRPTRQGDVLDLRSRVRKAGRSLYFIDVEASVGEVLVATARVTKSLVPMPATSAEHA